MLTIDNICHALYGRSLEALGPALHLSLTDIVIDSRAVQPRNLFVALRGQRTDGHLFLADAFHRGASAILAEPSALDFCSHATFVLPDGSLRVVGETEEPGPEGSWPEERNACRLVFIVRDSLLGLQQVAAWWRQQMPAVAIGITGSVGKTTSKEIIANVLAQRYKTLRSEGNLNNEIGLPLTLLRLRPEHQRVVLEMGMYAEGEISQLCKLARPRIGVVTNVGPVHMERLGSVERIAQAKSELPQALPTAAEGGVAILNADDPLVKAMANQTRAHVFTYGLNTEADLWADDITSQGLDGIRFRLHTGPSKPGLKAVRGRKAFHLRLPMLGRHSVHTALRGTAVGLVDGMDWPEIIAGLQDVRGQLRLMIVPGLRDTTLLDDTYNASPDSMLAALNLLEDIANTSHRPIAVLGDMYELGAYEEKGHRLVGGRAAQVAAKLITVGQRARWIAEEALACGMHIADVHAAENKDDAIAVLVGAIRPGDVILVKGSRAAGMETIVDTLSRPRRPGANQQ